MIKKVLIAEDHETANISIQKTLDELEIATIDYVHYCDDALDRIQKAQQSDNSYDLLITDLYFEEDDKKQQLTGGAALITAARAVQPALKVLVFSGEDRQGVIEPLFEKQDIDGYVRKARNDAKDLKLAINTIAKNQRYFPRHLTLLFRQKNAHEFTPYDITIISLLASERSQKEISDYLKEHQVMPSGLSSLEKRLKHIKDALGFLKNEQLVAYCKDEGLI